MVFIFYLSEYIVPGRAPRTAAEQARLTWLSRPHDRLPYPIGAFAFQDCTGFFGAIAVFPAGCISYGHPHGLYTPNAGKMPYRRSGGADPFFQSGESFAVSCIHADPPDIAAPAIPETAGSASARSPDERDLFLAAAGHHLF